MNITDPSLHFDFLSAINLQLSPQSCTIASRPHSTLSLRLQGNATIYHEGQTYTMETGSVLFIPAGCTYQIQSQAEELICINLNVIGELPLLPQIFVPKNIPVLAEPFQAAYQAWNEKRPGYYHKCMSLLYRILSRLDRQCSEAYQSPSFLSIKDAVQYMHMNFCDPDMKISTLCSIANLSDTQFRRHFLEVYQTTPVKYLQVLRINHAADLLVNSAFSIEEISAMSGFSDSKYFCYVFKKLKGCPPSVFRNTL